jgi:peptidyl-prolyl cis-trans isomerase SurA
MNTGPLSPADNYRLVKTVLDDMIDRTIVTQEAKREIKNKKQLDLFIKQADKIWMDEEMPPLLRQTATTNIYELKQKLEEREESLDEIQEAFRKEFLFRGFLEYKIGPKLRVDLPEMVDYYQAHIREFDQPATITWREVMVEVSKHPDRLAARRKADALLARLLRGEDLAVLARAESHGPNRSAGGSWQTSPGGYAVPAVNAALSALPLGQISQVIEGPSSYHIVRVEARRAAGPATFAEMQDRIRTAVRSEKVAKESNAYIAKLRNNTVVVTVFDGPAVKRTSGVSDPPRTPSTGR